MSNNWIQKGNTLNDGINNSHFGESVTLSSDGTILAVGAYGNDSNNKGAVYVYKYNDSNNSWEPKGNALSGANEGVSNDALFGNSVSLSSNGTILAVGAQGEESSRGAAYVYEYNDSNNSWEQKGNRLSGANAGIIEFSYFGYIVNLSSEGTILAVGAPNNDIATKGGVIVYEYNDSNNSWDPKGNALTGANVGVRNNAQFGRSVSLSSNGTVLAVGASGEGIFPDNQGSVFVYKYNESNGIWESKGNEVSGANAGVPNYGLFGWSVSLSSDSSILAVGAAEASFILNDDYGKGAAYVYKYNESNDSWLPKGNVLSGTFSDEYFGWSVDLSGDGNTLAVISNNNDNDNDASYGIASVYHYNDDSQWELKGTKLSPDTGNVADYGHSISLSNDGEILAFGFSLGAGNDGAVFVYSFDQAPPPCFTAGAMVQTDQGLIPIEEVKAGQHTIRNKTIMNATGIVSKNADGSDYLVRFEENALGEGSPNKETVCSPLHKIYYNGTNIPAGNLVGLPGIHRQEYKGEKLYNIQLEKHSHMYVNGMRAETLHPRNIWAKKTVSK